MREGRIHGTVPAEVEPRRPVALKPNREAGTPAAWLTQHQGIEVVCRDRTPILAEGAHRGALGRPVWSTGAGRGATPSRSAAIACSSRALYWLSTVHGAIASSRRTRST
ncbi:hypothetical protein GCM10010230_25500 [Streptomyces narbonensis]|nr:hypothetical protein GCM10010230_25500 [Streptomyces narbonensis]